MIKRPHEDWLDTNFTITHKNGEITGRRITSLVMV